MKECVMLAAGMSTRMGRWKMMLPWGNVTVLDSALNNALSFCDKVILVTGHRAAELDQRYASHPDIEICYNANYQMGMFSSIRCGVAKLQSNRFFLVPGDMPAIEPQVYISLWQHPSVTLCLQPYFDGGTGHPVLLPPSLKTAILTASMDSSLRNLMRDFGCETVAVNSPSVHWDLDTPAHYQQLMEKNCRFRPGRIF